MKSTASLALVSLLVLSVAIFGAKSDQPARAAGPAAAGTAAPAATTASSLPGCVLAGPPWNGYG